MYLARLWRWLKYYFWHEEYTTEPREDPIVRPRVGTMATGTYRRQATGLLEHISPGTLTNRVYTFADTGEVSHVVVSFGETWARSYPLPPWAIGTDLAKNWQQWANPWRWPAEPRPYEVTLTAEQIAEQIAIRDAQWTSKYMASPAEPRPYEMTLTAEQIAIRDAQRTSKYMASSKTEAFKDWDLLTESEKTLFGQLAPQDSSKVVAYPPKVDDLDARQWVSQQLQERTGGLTRHPMDVTSYPEAPNEADRAAQREYRTAGVRAGYFSHGMSMRYLRELQSRAQRKDPTLSTEDLMSLRSRGLI